MWSRGRFFLPEKETGTILRVKRKKAHGDMSLAFFGGAPGEIRTPDLQVRSLLLYPAELRAHDGGQNREKEP